MSFFQKLFSNPQRSLLCVGLDTDLEKVPRWYLEQVTNDYFNGNAPKPASGEAGELELHRFIAQHDGLMVQIISAFNRFMVEATEGSAACFKLNLGFYLNSYVAGLRALQRTVTLIHDRGGLAILDGKFNDIGNSSEQYAHFAYEVVGADAVTVSPYLGHVDALEPFLRRSDKGVFVLCHTSNKGARELQEQRIERVHGETPLYLEVATTVATEWNHNGNCGLVMGATYPHQLAEAREYIGGSVPFLVPGIGKQQGDLEASVRSSVNTQGEGAIFNISRDIIFASADDDMFQAAGEKAAWYHREITSFRDIAVGERMLP